MASTYATTRKDADAVRAARGFASFKAWATANRKAAREQRMKKRDQLADALDREYDRYIKANL